MREILIPLMIAPGLPPKGSVLLELAGSSMGTTWSAKVMARASDGVALRAGLQAQLDTVVQEMSHWRSDSDLSRYNQASADSWHDLPAGMAQVLACALQVRARSGAAYDPCAGALVNLWGFGAHQRYDQAGFATPDAADIAAILAQMRAQQPLQFDAGQRRLHQPGGLQLDFSSVAKGFAVDRMACYLQAMGWQHYLVEAGGELRGAGVKADGQPWWVALEAVPNNASLPDDGCLLALHGLAVATSGDYRRCFQQSGQRFAHTLDPRSGYPLDNQVVALSVLHAECMWADAWSTALMVLGPQAGLALAEQEQLAARFVLRQGGQIRELVSSRWQALLQ